MYTNRLRGLLAKIQLLHHIFGKSLSIFVNVHRRLARTPGHLSGLHIIEREV